MKKKLIYIALSLLAAIAAILLSVIIYDNFFIKLPTQNPETTTINAAKSVKQPERNITKEVQALKEEVEERTDVLSIATEIDDYVQGQKHKDDNVSKPLLKAVCEVPEVSKKSTKKVFHDGIPRLAIIMDDIGNANQVRAFQKIPFAITPSIFPVTSSRTDTPMHAKKFKSYMVHLPMEAFNFARPEENTLQVTDTLDEIEEKIAAIHQDFPDAVAINNHTGSKFTSNSEAMDRLFCILDKYDITFIDSKTAPHTKGKEIGKLHKKHVLERHVFLDNEPDVPYILNQLKKAVRYAKKHGVAIAICHPRPETFEAFKKAASLIKDVKMVTIDELL